MEILKELFTPFGKVSKRNLDIMLILQISIVVLLWIFSPVAFLPTPQAVGKAWVASVTDDHLLGELITSFFLCVKSMLWAIVISATISYIYYIPFTKYIPIIVGKFRFLSSVGFSFFFTVLTSSGSSLKTSMLTFAIMVFFVNSFTDMLISVDKCKLDDARTLGMSRFRTWYEVIIFGKLPDLFTVIGQTFAMAWMLIPYIEGLQRSDGGVGILLLNAGRTFSFDKIFAIQFTILLAGMGSDYLIQVVRGIVCPVTKLQKI